MDKWISIAGSIASIGAAMWAFIEALKASRSASRAQQIRDEMVFRREIIEVSQVHTETNRILRVVSKIGGPATNLKMLAGIDINGIAKDLEEYARFINEHSTHYTEFFKNKARELCDDINPDIQSLSEAQTAEQIKAVGTRIYQNISRFLPNAKSFADERRERVSR